MFRNSKGQEKPIEALGYQMSNGNTLDREIVVIIKGMNDDIFPEHDAVKTLRDLIIRVASDPTMRSHLDALRGEAEKVMGYLAIIDEKRMRNKLSELSPGWLRSTEERSGVLFWDFMHLSSATEEDLGAIHWLSWAWKLPATYGKLKHMAWCWVVIMTVFGLVR